MSKDKLHITSQVPTLEQMDRYLKGELPEAERKRVEDALKDDPFLQDAMEGLEMVEEGHDVQGAIKRIQTESFKRASIKVKKRDQLGKRRSRVGPQNYTTLIISSAAAITLLLVSVFLIHQRTNSPNTATMAQHESAPAADEDALARESSSAAAPESEIMLGANTDSSNKQEAEALIASGLSQEKREDLETQSSRRSNERMQSSADKDKVIVEKEAEELPLEDDLIVSENSSAVEANSSDYKQLEKPSPDPSSAVSPKPSVVVAEGAVASKSDIDDRQQVATDTAPRLEADELEAIPLSPVIAGNDSKEKKGGRTKASATPKPSRKRDSYAYSEDRELDLAEQSAADKVFGEKSKQAILNDLLVSSIQLYRDSSYDESLENLKEVLQSDPANATANYYTGSIYRSFGQLKSATAHLKVATEQGKSDYYDIAQWELALTLLGRGKKGAARKVLYNIVVEKSEYAERAQQLLEELKN